MRLSVEHIDDNLTKTFIATMRGNVVPICSVIGGISALKVINEEEYFEQNRITILEKIDDTGNVYDLPVKNMKSKERNVANSEHYVLCKSFSFACEDEGHANTQNNMKIITNIEESDFVGDFNYDVTDGIKNNSVDKNSETLTSKKDIKIVENTKQPRKQRVCYPVQNNVKKQCFHRMMWSELPEVIDSGILNELPKKKIQFHEEMFEIIASEASYYQSLMILTSHFFESDLFKLNEIKDRPVSQLDKHHIFSNVILIMYTSQNFLNDLDKRWRDKKPLLTQNYVTYLRNQVYQRKALKRLSENELFKSQLNKLEKSSVCGRLSMDSYLMLPMQRLTRLKLLLDALLKLMYCEDLQDIVTEEHINIAEMSLEKCDSFNYNIKVEF